MPATRHAEPAAVDAPPRHAPRRWLPRRGLLALGWTLAALLPLVVLGLVATEFGRYTEQREMRQRIVVDAVERQLADRLYMLDLQLATASRWRSRGGSGSGRPLSCESLSLSHSGGELSTDSPGGV